MNIEINSEYKEDEILKINKYILDKLYKKGNRWSRLMLLFGGGFLLLSIFGSEDRTEVETIISYTLSICILYFVYFNYRVASRGKKLSKVEVDRVLKKRMENNSEFNLKLSDSHIFYKNFEQKTELKWSVVNSYYLTSEFIIINTDINTLPAIYIFKKWLSDSEFDELLKFCEKNLKPLKKLS